jgi:hypothetical protein
MVGTKESCSVEHHLSCYFLTCSRSHHHHITKLSGSLTEDKVKFNSIVWKIFGLMGYLRLSKANFMEDDNFLVAKSASNSI